MSDDITNLKIEVAVINEKLDKQSEKLDSVISLITEHIKDEQIWKKEIMDIKADKKEVDDIRKTINRVAWIIICAVIAALLNLVLK
jgi:hypothetical protein